MYIHTSHKCPESTNGFVAQHLHPLPSSSSILPAIFQPQRKKPWLCRGYPAPSTLLPPLRSVLGEYLILATNPAFLWLLPVSAKHVNSSVTPETSPAALSASQTTAPTHVSLSVGIPTPLPSLFLILPPLQTCLCHHCESRLDFM